MATVELTDAHLQEIEKAAPWLASLCAGLIRESPTALDAHLSEICKGFAIEDTRASAHCYIVGLDGNGRPLIGGLAQLLAQSVIQYCIPRREIDRALQSFVQTNNPRETVALELKAQALFTKLTNTGEGGELLLYLLIEAVLRIPQLLCKMSHKTSSNVHYHGVDGIHGTVDESTGILALYWGEAKLYADVSDAIRECFESIAPYLLEPRATGSASDRDFNLLRDNLDLNNPALETALKEYLDPTSPLHRKVQVRAACLIGYNSASYPTAPNSKLEDALRHEITSGLDNLWGRVKKQVTHHKLESFTLEVFCIPFPNVELFRKAFRKELKLD